MARAYEKKRRLMREAAKQMCNQLRQEAPSASPATIRRAAQALTTVAYHRLERANG